MWSAETRSTDDNRHLDAETVHVGKFRGDFMNADRINAKALFGGESLAGYLE
jgi:hypothetical protein